MAIDNLSQRVFELSQRLEELQAKCVSNPANAPDILSGVIEDFQISLEELSAADEELMQQNEELIEAQEERERYLRELEDSHKALRESEEKYRELVQNTNSIILKYDINGKITFFNEYAQRFFGYTKDEIIGKDVMILVPKTESTGEGLETLADDILKDPEGFTENVNENILRNGERVWISWRNKVILDSDGCVVGNLAVGQEITERKHMEADLEQLASFPKINPNPIIEVDLEGCVHFLNPAAKELFPGLLESGCNHPWLTDWEQVVQIFHKRGTSAFVRDIFVGDRWYQQSMHFVPNTQAIRIYGLDITERRQAEDALQEANEELEATGEELRQQNGELMHAQSALQESEEKYRTIVETANEGIWVVDSEAQTTYVNKRMAEMLGFSPEEMIGKKSSEFMDEEERARLELMLERRRQGIEESFEFKFIRKDGSFLWAHSNAAPLRDRDGKFVGSLGMLTDITERKRAEEALQMLSRQRQLALDAARMGWWRYDPVTRIASWDDRYKEIFGVIGDQSPNDEILKRLHPEDLPGVWAKVEAALDPTNPQPYSAEYRINHPDGSVRWIEAHGIALFEGVGENRRAVDFVGTAADITERKQVEDVLRTTLQRLYTVLSSMYSSILLVTNEGRTEFANQAFSDFFGLKGYSADLIGLTSSEMIEKIKNAYLHPDEEVKRIGEIVGRGHPVKGEEIAMSGDRTCLRDFIPICIDGKSYGRLWHHLDITERKLMEEELRKARDELELRVKARTSELQDAKENLEIINEELQVEISEHEKTEKDLLKAKETAEAAVEAKAAFLANMSHELRTPLNAVIGFSSLLLDDNLTQEQKEDIERIRNGGEALLTIISDILEFSRAEKEKVELEHQSLSLKASIEESLDMVAVQAIDKGLNLAYTIAYGTPDTIIGDPGRLRQVLVNLLSNAVKFTDVGDISVSVSSKALVGNKCQITFSVKDTGIGMPQDKMDRLFKPFTQLEYTLSRKRDGAGLGLSISKKLVELMGGEIWAESEESKGSTFRFTIQAEVIPGKQLDLEDKATEYENLSAEKPFAILVAEDNPSNQKVLVEMLKRLGYRADAVADGVEVLQALQVRPYDLIFMDIKMPEMDGLTATREIRKLWPNNGPKIIAITAFAMDGDQEKCLEAGMDGYIAKPVKVNDLAILLRNIPCQE